MYPPGQIAYLSYQPENYQIEGIYPSPSLIKNKVFETCNEHMDIKKKNKTQINREQYMPVSILQPVSARRHQHQPEGLRLKLDKA